MVGRAVFLDRDGVLSVPILRNGRSYAPRLFEEFVLYDDAVASVARLKAAGCLVMVITNQPDVGAGLTDREDVEHMHAALMDATDIDGIEVCYETRGMPGNRLKPSPAMLKAAATRHRVDLGASWMVGDRASDIEAGRRAGCATVFIDRGYTAEPRPEGQSATVTDLAEAVDFILASPTRKGNVHAIGR